MAGFDREGVVARSRALQVCEIGTIDCIHVRCSEKRASALATAAGAAKAAAMEGEDG
jgi:hypothetical protein